MKVNCTIELGLQVEDTIPKEPSINHVDNNITASNYYFHESLVQSNISNDKHNNVEIINKKGCI